MVSNRSQLIIKESDWNLAQNSQFRANAYRQIANSDIYDLIDVKVCFILENVEDFLHLCVRF